MIGYVIHAVAVQQHGSILASHRNLEPHSSCQVATLVVKRDACGKRCAGNACTDKLPSGCTSTEVMESCAHHGTPHIPTSGCPLNRTKCAILNIAMRHSTWPGHVSMRTTRRHPPRIPQCWLVLPAGTPCAPADLVKLLSRLLGRLPPGSGRSAFCL